MFLLVELVSLAHVVWIQVGLALCEINNPSLSSLKHLTIPSFLPHPTLPFHRFLISAIFLINMLFDELTQLKKLIVLFPMLSFIPFGGIILFDIDYHPLHILNFAITF